VLQLSVDEEKAVDSAPLEYVAILLVEVELAEMAHDEVEKALLEPVLLDPEYTFLPMQEMQCSTKSEGRCVEEVARLQN